MWYPVPSLRAVAVALAALLAAMAQAKEYCIGQLAISHQHADGTIGMWNMNYVGVYGLDTSVTLAPGESLRLTQLRWGDCTDHGGLLVHYVPLGETAGWNSPVISPYALASTTVVISQSGSYYIEQGGVDVFQAGVRIDVNAQPQPIPMGLAIKMPYPYNFRKDVLPADTCLSPCVSAYLAAGESVVMWAVYGGLVPTEGNALVRYAPEGDTVTFDSPSAVIPLAEDGSYSFSADGSYLLSVEGPSFITPAFAYVRVSHLPHPRVDMSMTIERADGTEEEVAYVQPYVDGSVPLSVELGPGDSLRIDHHFITEPCSSLRLHINRANDWSPAVYYGPLAIDTPSTAGGFRIGAPGNYYVRQVSGCVFPTSARWLHINPPTPQQSIVVSVRHSDGEEDELFSTNALVDPPPHLNTHLGPGDSIHVHVGLVEGWCNLPRFEVRRSAGSDEPGLSSPLMQYNGYGSFVNDLVFRGDGRFLLVFKAPGQNSCFESQYVFLDATFHTAKIHLLVSWLQQDGGLTELVYAVAGAAVPHATIELPPGDSLLANFITEFTTCTSIAFKGYRSTGSTVDTSDPVFIDVPMYGSGVRFRQTGLLLLTMEDSCGAISGSAVFNVSEALATGISGGTGADATFRYADGILWVRTDVDARLQVRNALGQVVRDTKVVGGLSAVAIPAEGTVQGVYFASLHGMGAGHTYRFIVN